MMTSSRSSDVFITGEGNVPVGMIRHVDIVRAVADGIQPAKVKVEEIMLSPAPYVEEGANAEQVASMLEKNEVRRILVRDGEEVVGLIEAGELFNLISSSQKNVDVFKAISVRTRLRIAELLSVNSMSVVDLADELGMKPITVRHHIDILRRNGMIEEYQDELFRKVGRPLSLFKLSESILKKSSLDY